MDQLKSTLRRRESALESDGENVLLVDLNRTHRIPLILGKINPKLRDPN